MTFDSSALCARTPAGAAELALPSKGLSLGQRRLLTLLENPAAAEELAQKYHLEPEKLARDLTRLVELHLVELLGATNVTPAAPVRRSTARTRGSATPARGSMAPVVIGHGTRRSSAWPLAAGAAALLLIAGIWYGNRARDATPATPTATIAAPLVKAETAAPAPAPAPAPSALPGNREAIPAVAVVLRGNAAPAELRPDIRPGLLPVASRTNLPPEPRTRPAPESPLIVPVTGTPSTSPAAAPVTAGVALPPAAAPIATGGSPAVVAAPVAAGVAAPATPSVVATGGTGPATAFPTTASQTTASSPTASPATASPTTASPQAASPITTAPVNAPAETPRPVQIAAAAPAAAPPATAARPAVLSELKVISRDPPEFPREAAADGVKSGVVSARLHVDARGSVTRVDILTAQPPKVFDRAVRKALLYWRFEPPASGNPADLDVEVKFQRE